MTLQDALTQARDSDAWLRPISWRGKGSAFIPHDVDDTAFVRGARALGLTAAQIEGQWDVVSPEQIAGERK